MRYIPTTEELDKMIDNILEEEKRSRIKLLKLKKVELSKTLKKYEKALMHFNRAVLKNDIVNIYHYVRELWIWADDLYDEDKEKFYRLNKILKKEYDNLLYYSDEQLQFIKDINEVLNLLYEYNLIYRMKIYRYKYKKAPSRKGIKKYKKVTNSLLRYIDERKRIRYEINRHNELVLYLYNLSKKQNIINQMWKV